jgi:hypothetical protein
MILEEAFKDGGINPPRAIANAARPSPPGAQEAGTALSSQ